MDPSFNKYDRFILPLSTHMDRHQVSSFLREPDHLQPEPGTGGGEQLKPVVDGVKGVVVIPAVSKYQKAVTTTRYWKQTGELWKWLAFSDTYSIGRACNTTKIHQFLLDGLI